jgi:DNA/RNA-binding domain of Phe-tRNA-synthetase-like protein
MHAESSHAVSMTIDDAVRERHPDVRVRGFAVTGLAAAAPHLDVPSPADVVAAAGRLPPGAELIEDPVIHGWREAFRRSGLRPSRYRSSVEALVRRVVRGEDVLTATPVVRLYCALSVIHVSPLGAYDLDRLGSGPIELRFARPASDTFEPIGGDASDMPLRPDVAVYAVKDRVICYSYNYRDAEGTSVDAETDGALFVGEAVIADQHDALDAALDDLRRRLLAAGAVKVADVAA